MNTTKRTKEITAEYFKSLSNVLKNDFIESVISFGTTKIVKIENKDDI